MNNSFFIQKNSQELRTKIENMGYKLKTNSIPEVDNCICIFQKGIYMTFFDLLGGCPISDAKCCDSEDEFIKNIQVNID